MKTKNYQKSSLKIISLQQNMGAFHGSISLNFYFSKNDEIIFHMTTMTHAHKLSHLHTMHIPLHATNEKMFHLKQFVLIFYLRLLLIILL
jgi:hypothetical protein